ncbi:MAG: hypothetical protein N4A71_20195 [Carboxylicivirga sp.]|jgi:hypothetical protein|nr:hypothetical protein [Carboxylicivirga sp.]
MQNIQFDYLYRDEGNYKDFASIVYRNPNKLSIDFVENLIQQNLIEDTWFDPDKWGIPRFSFHHFTAFGLNSHLWYEFETLSYTQAMANAGSIDTLLKSINHDASTGTPCLRKS